MARKELTRTMKTYYGVESAMQRALSARIVSNPSEMTDAQISQS